MASKTAEIYDYIKDEIIKLKFAPDEIINEKDLADRYDSSKTPVREALAMLVQEGYLKKIPRVGYIIRQLSDSEYTKLIYLRYTLESGVVAYILRNCTDAEIESLREFCHDRDVSYKDFAETNMKFHYAMADLTKNDYLIACLHNTFERLIRVPSPTIYAEVHAEPHLHHLQLIDAMKARDLNQCMALLRNECRRDDDTEAQF